jgi:hypothetical protein
MPDSDLVWLVSSAVFYGLVLFVATLIVLQRSVQFRRRGYWGCLACAAAIALALPLAYVWTQSNSISFMDAFLPLQVRVGSWRIAKGYAIFAGIALAGFIYFLILRRPNG